MMHLDDELQWKQVCRLPFGLVVARDEYRDWRWWRRFRSRNPMMFRHPIRAWRWSRIRGFRHPMAPSLLMSYDFGFMGGVFNDAWLDFSGDTVRIALFNDSADLLDTDTGGE